MPKSLLKGIEPDKKDLSEAAVLNAIADAMLGRGFSTLWSAPANANRVSFGDREKRIYLVKLATTGRKSLSSAHAGVTNTTVNVHKKQDAAFSAACEEATEYFRDILVGEMYRRGVEGFKQQVLGGKNRDQIFEVVTYSDKMLDTLGKIHVAEMQKANDGAVTVHETKIINNQFDMANMPPEDLAMMKQLLINQQKRLEDTTADAEAIEGKVLPDGR